MNAEQTREAPAFGDAEKTHAAGQANSLLQALIGRGWRTTQELVEEVGHRFSTSVQWLRDRGHVIDKRPGDGRSWEYCYLTFYETGAVTPTWQERYYQSPHWRAKRQERLERDSHRCCWCHTAFGLHVHHWRYDLFDERVEDLMTLCGDCHSRVHEYDTVKVHFPRFLRVDLLAKLDGYVAPPPQPVEPDDDPPPFGMLFAIEDESPPSYYD